MSQRRKEQEPPSPTTLVVMGLLVGLAVGAAFTSWEWSLVRWMGLDLPTGEDRQMVLIVHGLLGGGLGAILGLFGLRGGSWAIAMAATLTAYLVSGKVGVVIAQAGIPPVLALLAVPFGAAIGVMAARFEMPDSRRLAVASALFVLLTLGLVVNLHLLPSPLAPIALLVDGAVLCVASVVAAGVAFTGGKTAQTQMLALVLLANALGWGAYALQPAGGGPQRTLEPGDKPPVVMIVIDTLRADHLGAYGYNKPTSPNIDAFARRAIVYENARTQAPWTLPAMGSLLTGRMPSGHGAGVNTGTHNRRSALRRSVPTLAELLRDAGYSTVGITTNPWTSAAFGFDRGFDVYDDRVGPYALPVAVHPLRVAGLDPLRASEFRDADQLTATALEHIEALGDSGWFVLVHYMDVHGPHSSSRADLDAVRADETGGYIGGYDASIRRVDRAVGALLDGLPPRALVILTSDHGEQLDEGRAAPVSAPVGVRHGHTVYDELLRVPLMVQAPGSSASRVRRLVGLVDIVPTLTARLGLDAPDRLDGFTLGEVGGTHGPADPQRQVLAEALRWGNEQQAAARSHYKYIRRHKQGYELYDLTQSPFETQQMAVGEDQTSLVLRSFLAEMPPVGTSALDEPVQLGADLQSLLERLGYTDR